MPSRKAIIDLITLLFCFISLVHSLNDNDRVRSLYRRHLDKRKLPNERMSIRFPNEFSKIGTPLRKRSFMSIPSAVGSLVGSMFGTISSYFGQAGYSPEKFKTLANYENVFQPDEAWQAQPTASSYKAPAPIKYGTQNNNDRKKEIENLLDSIYGGMNSINNGPNKVKSLKKSDTVTGNNNFYYIGDFSADIPAEKTQSDRNKKPYHIKPTYNKQSPNRESVPNPKLVASIPQSLPQRKQSSSDPCNKTYPVPPKCPSDPGFFRIGSSCYFISSLAKENMYASLELSKMMCSLLDDTNKVSRGDWSLATFNSDEEVMDMSTVLQFADAKVRQIPLWIAQARVLSDEDAQKTGTPFWNENPCTGPVNVENASLEDIEEIRRQISESCLYLAFNDETNESMETDCQYSAVGFICELALDAQPFKYTRGDDEMLMDRVKIPYSKTYVGPKTDQRFKVMFKGSRRVADYST